MTFVKKLRFILPLCAALSLPAAAQAPFSIKTSLGTAPEVRSTVISVAGGEVLEFSAADVERRLGYEPGSLQGFTVTALPPASQGALFLDGVEVEAYDYLTRGDVDRLCFAAAEAISAASFTFIPYGDNAAAASLYINVTEHPNLPPVIETANLETVKNISAGGYIGVSDPEEDSVTIKLVTPPLKGQVTFRGQNFIYEPFRDMTGKDQFAVCAVDSAGNYSVEAVVSVWIEKTKDSFTYIDMAGNPSLYAAVKLRDSGVLSGRQAGGKWFFDPEAQLNRGDFLVMVLAAADMTTSATVNTGLPNDSSIPGWLKPYVKKAMDEGIISPAQSFNWREIPIRAEAVLMTDRAAKISDVKEFALSMPDRDAIPDWALKSYMDLAAYKMLDLHDGNAYPAGALTNSYAADLVWQLYKHVNR